MSGRHSTPKLVDDDILSVELQRAPCQLDETAAVNDIFEHPAPESIRSVHTQNRSELTRLSAENKDRVMDPERPRNYPLCFCELRLESGAGVSSNVIRKISIGLQLFPDSRICERAHVPCPFSFLDQPCTVKSMQCFSSRQWIERK
jgi:hypothetical protein